jgi:hypothetical protein
MRSIKGKIWIVLVGAVLLLWASPVVFCQSPDPGGLNLQMPGLADAAPQASTGDDAHKLSVNPVTGQTTAVATDYTPLTPVERWKLYYKQSYWSVGAYFGPLFAALALDQSTGTPQQWGGGFRGYGRRVLSRVASGDVVQNSIQFPAAALLHEDVRYIASDQQGFRRRAVHAIVYSFLTYNSQGHPTPNIANIGGYFGAAAISTLWLPGPQKTLSYTVSNGSESMALSIPVNLLQEFWPDITRKVFHRR